MARPPQKKAQIVLPILWFCLVAVVVGCVAVVAANLALLGLAIAGVPLFAQMSIDDAIVLLEALGAIGACIFALLGPRIRIGLFVRHRAVLESTGLYLALVFAFVAALLLACGVDQSLTGRVPDIRGRDYAVALVISILFFYGLKASRSRRRLSENDTERIDGQEEDSGTK